MSKILDEETEIFIGPAGWSYKDWVGPVYPCGARLDQLVFVAGLFDCIELNSSFYRVPGRSAVSSWARRLADMASFRFTVKVWQRLTHEQSGTSSDARMFIDSFSPLLAQDRIGAFLLQFPWSFKRTEANRDRIRLLSEWFAGHPTAVELRHGSWNGSDTFELLEGTGLAFCNIDQPLIGNSMPPTNNITDDRIAYVRLHGRNTTNWFRSGAGRDDRYDYCYSEEELAEWKGRIMHMLGRTKRLFIITNNHFRGQALVNALQLRHLLERKRIYVPTALRRAYPFLAGIDASRPDQGHLLDND